MKKIWIVILLIMLIGLFIVPVSANMAAPKPNDLATNISFEKNDDLIVTSEVLDIHFKGEYADINATYSMKNTKDYTVKTDSMFISPSIDGNDTLVYANDVKLSYISEEYYATNEDISINDWQYIILVKDNPYLGIKIQTITFTLTFKPLEEYDVSVNYSYRLGGRASRIDNLKYGTLEYYLAPASMWKSFNNLTINLYLDSDMPVLEQSNIDFTKVGKRHYQYQSNEMPKENLKIKIGQNDWQKFLSSFKNPYQYLFLIFIISIIIIFFLTASIIVSIIRKKLTR